MESLLELGKAEGGCGVCERSWGGDLGAVTMREGVSTDDMAGGRAETQDGHSQSSQL